MGSTVEQGGPVAPRDSSGPLTMVAPMNLRSFWPLFQVYAFHQVHALGIAYIHVYGPVGGAHGHEQVRVARDEARVHRPVDELGVAQQVHDEGLVGVHAAAVHCI